MRYPRLILPIAALILSGCASVGQNCQPVKAWTDSEEAQMSHDVAMLPANSPLIAAMIDYARMRASAKACAE